MIRRTEQAIALPAVEERCAAWGLFGICRLEQYLRALRARSLGVVLFAATGGGHGAAHTRWMHSVAAVIASTSHSRWHSQDKIGSARPRFAACVASLFVGLRLALAVCFHGTREGHHAAGGYDTVRGAASESWRSWLCDRYRARARAAVPRGRRRPHPDVDAGAGGGAIGFGLQDHEGPGAPALSDRPHQDAGW